MFLQEDNLDLKIFYVMAFYARSWCLHSIEASEREFKLFWIQIICNVEAKCF